LLKRARHHQRRSQHRYGRRLDRIACPMIPLWQRSPSFGTVLAILAQLLLIQPDANEGE